MRSPSPLLEWVILWAVGAMSWAGCAAGGSCSSDSHCETLQYCSEGTCQQDCERNEQCAAGQICTSSGRCVVGVADAGTPDAGSDAGLDAPMSDVPSLDAPSLDDVPATDVPSSMPDVPADVPAPDTGIDAPMPDAGTDAGRDAGTDAGRDAGPVTPSPGTYIYSRTAVGGLNDSVAVAFHPDGTYALVLERTDEVHVYDWASGTATRIDLRVASRTVTLDDVAFSADGATAWIVGHERISSTDSGVIIGFDDAAWRAGDGAAAFSRLAATTSGERPSGIAIPRAPSGGPGDGRPVVLTQSGTSPYIARLRELDPETGTFDGLFVARSTGAGCDDLTFADNEFGEWGIVLACGTNGAEILYYTEVAGVGEWRAGTGGFGNVSRLDAHPSGDYALIVNWSSTRIYRHESGGLLTTSSSPSLVNGMWDVSFSPDGRFALILGSGRGTMLRGTVYEFRHDLYSAAEMTDVSIEGFALAPYLASSSTQLKSSAWRPGCDGGLIVGGTTSGSGSTGMVIEFQRSSGIDCR